MLSSSVSGRWGSGSQLQQKRLHAYCSNTQSSAHKSGKKRGGRESEDGCMSFFVAVLSALIIPALPDPQEIRLESLIFIYSPINVHIFQGWSYITHLRGRYICISVMKVMDQGFVLAGRTK